GDLAAALILGGDGDGDSGGDVGQLDGDGLVVRGHGHAVHLGRRGDDLALGSGVGEAVAAALLDSLRSVGRAVDSHGDAIGAGLRRSHGLLVVAVVGPVTGGGILSTSGTLGNLAGHVGLLVDLDRGGSHSVDIVGGHAGVLAGDG